MGHGQERFAPSGGTAKVTAAKPIIHPVWHSLNDDVDSGGSGTMPRTKLLRSNEGFPKRLLDETVDCVEAAAVLRAWGVEGWAEPSLLLTNPRG